MRLHPLLVERVDIEQRHSYEYEEIYPVLGILYSYRRIQLLYLLCLTRLHFTLSNSNSNINTVLPPFTPRRLMM
jgi:hypothetical protein